MQWDFGVLFWRGISLASKIWSHKHFVASLDALCPDPGCTLEEAEDEGGEDDQEEDRPKKKARIT
jgi:hypothetical protein